MMEFSLNRDGIAGVCGVCGDKGFMPGDEEVDIEAGTMLGTLASCRLDELDDRGNCMEEVIDSVKALLDSRISANLES
jgi:hypothetical protein